MLTVQSIGGGGFFRTSQENFYFIKLGLVFACVSCETTVFITMFWYNTNVANISFFDTFKRFILQKWAKK